MEESSTSKTTVPINRDIDTPLPNKNLTDWFDKVFVINCAHRPDRKEQVLAHLEATGMADIAKVIVYQAIVGDWVSNPSDWNSGRGAWGCLRSHQRLCEDVMHIRDDRDQLLTQNYLVLEDDVFFLDNALEELNKFMVALPTEWDQIYLGGQHRQDPLAWSPGVVIGRSVNRTHAYALNAKNYQAFYRHISYASDYRGTNKHIDHQLELAHRRTDWAVYCPEKWICGQEAGTSNISGKVLERMTWI